ncbi:MAG: radical SAM protein [Candidatus Omnitrophica bacterium]|nr:radical SAM protein [Candidatus Omnitrophota bacterium]
MKKILLLNPPGSRKFLRDQYCSSATKADYYWPAVDLLVLSGILSDHFELEVLDAIALNADKKTTIEKILSGSYDALISLSSSASMDEDFALFETIKAKSNIIIIINAGFSRDDPKKYLEEHDFIDAIIMDYIKLGIVDYLQAKPGPYQGLGYKSNKQIIGQDSDLEQNTSFSYPVPRHDLFALKNYYLPQARKLPFSCCLISYGCKYGCTYCSSGSIGFKLRDIDNIMLELKAIKALGISEVHFPDFTFTADMTHARKLCQAMIDQGLELSWDCLTRVDCFDMATALLLKKAGAHTIQFGIETQNEQLLKKMGKPISNEQVKRCFAICKQVGLETIGFFIIGLPGEDAKSIKKSIDFACELDCDYAAFSIYVPDHGSLLRKQLETIDPLIANIKNFDRTMYPVIDNLIVSRRVIWQLRNYALKKFYLRPSYIWRQIKKINSLEKIKSVGKISYSLIKGII